MNSACLYYKNYIYNNQYVTYSSNSTSCDDWNSSNSIPCDYTTTTSNDNLLWSYYDSAIPVDIPCSGGQKPAQEQKPIQEDAGRKLAQMKKTRQNRFRLLDLD